MREKTGREQRAGFEQTGFEQTGVKPARSAPPQGSAPRPLPRVLCVDDEPCTLSTLRRVLRCSFEVVSRQEPLAALALVQQGSSFAVVLADMNMPGMTGLELLRSIRALSPATVCVLWTGDVLSDRAAGVREGVFRSLGKQCQLQTLRQALSDAAEQHVRLAASQASSGAVGALR